MSEKNVHTEHCCEEHGCKYGDNDCPVAQGLQKQSYRCEWCDEDLHSPDPRIGFLANLPTMKGEEGKPLKGFSLSVNDWLVQLVTGKRWYSAYFKDPPGGPAKVKYGSVLEAMYAVIREAQKDLGAHQ